jgi:predicted NBD/HSP70 family sugar kinase
VRRRRSWRARGGPLLPLLAKAVRAVAAGDDEGRVLGIGIAMPGPFDARLDDSHASALPARLAAATGLPVLLENDATAAALGERLYGAGRALRHFLLVYVGVGLGGGLILDGAPYKGAWGNAGELGHVVVVPAGVRARAAIAAASKPISRSRWRAPSSGPPTSTRDSPAATARCCAGSTTRRSGSPWR